jgi:peptidoglycan-N-acetylglucosamine deacetylase
MNMSLNYVLWLMLAFVILDIVGLSIIVFLQIRPKLLKIKTERMDDFLLNKFAYTKDTERNRYADSNKRLLLNQFIELNQSIILPVETHAKVIKYMQDKDIDKYYIRRLKSFYKFRRIEAATILGYLPSWDVRTAMKEALENEELYPVKLYIASALSHLGDEASIPILVNSLIKAPSYYQLRVMELLIKFDDKFLHHIPSLIENESYEIRALIVRFASSYIDDQLKEYLIQTALNAKDDLKEEALFGLSKLYSEELSDFQFLYSLDTEVRGASIRSLGWDPTRENLNLLLDFMNDPELETNSIYALSNLLARKPVYLNEIVQIFHDELDKNRKARIASVLANRIEYFMINIQGRDKEAIQMLIREILYLNRTSSLIGFLNKNRNIEIENEILSVIKEVIIKSDEIRDQFRLYLDDRILTKLDLEKKVISSERKQEKQEKDKVIILYRVLFLAILMVPLVFVIKHFTKFNSFPALDLLKIYVLDFNHYFIFYSFAINFIYLAILFFSLLGVIKQSKYWNVKKLGQMFQKKMLPSISIIAPAYCEELNIIESCNSLLNLKYPDYELVVVNDGSSDQTLNTLIEYYDLEKIDRTYRGKINTMPVRGFYYNGSLPNLIVVDKFNGGKADSLNVGINVSRKEYFCGIDSDSLLESDALLKVASGLVDYEEESIAAGGNILPINGCSVEMGELTNINIPKNIVARFQTIEYIRAFIAGRVGWAYLDSLLIISGAFGLFLKSRVISIGGYLASSGKFGKDTVGEDMELVVRLARSMKKKKIPFKVHYAYNANCWTEVPEDMNILSKQRDRWHRGLVDILTFHRIILFNRHYGRMGLLAFPYFAIFETLGPLFEIQGYFMVLLAAILGMVNVKLALLLFTSTILMGTFISISSLAMMGNQTNQFKFGDIMKLIGFAIFENFGFRQISSFWRVTGFINSLKKPKGWGKMVRKGIGTSQPKKA